MMDNERSSLNATLTDTSHKCRTDIKMKSGLWLISTKVKTDGACRQTLNLPAPMVLYGRRMKE